MIADPYRPHRHPANAFEQAQNKCAAIFYAKGGYIDYDRGSHFFSPPIPPASDAVSKEDVASNMLTWVALVSCVRIKDNGVETWRDPEKVKEAAHCLLYLLRNGVFKTTAPERGKLEPRRILCKPKPETCEPAIAALENLLTTLP
jgi:hypothetical protein